ncbi:MAG: DHHA1 domain-containing protein [Promethearchaeota archaeon]
MNKYVSFLEEIGKIKGQFVEIIKSRKPVVNIITHHDADGISAGAIASITMKRENIPFQTRVVKQLAPKYIEDFISRPANHDFFYIFTDLGSGQLSIINKYFNLKNILILDHHELDPSFKYNDGEIKILQANPWLYDIDGSIEISGAGVTYLFAKALNEKNRDLSYLGIVGAIGDIQETGKNSSLVGLNRTILQDAKDLGLISEKIDIKIYGRFKPLHLALSNMTFPYLPGLSGDEGACVKFLQKIGIPLSKNGTDQPRTLSDLSKEEKSRLVSAIIEHSFRYGIKSLRMEDLIGNIYLLKKETRANNLRDIREFVATLNSCGRLGFGSIGICIAMGDRGELYLEAQELINDYRKKLANYIEWIKTSNALKKTDTGLQVIEGGSFIDDAMIGTLTSILLSSKNVDKDMPIIGWARLKDDLNTVKISARGSKNLVKKGLNLGAAIRDALQELSIESQGGGHAPAAGAELPFNKLDDFLKVMGRIILKQLNMDIINSKGHASWI